MEHRWTHSYEAGSSRGPGSALYLKAVVALHLSDKFSPLSYQIVCQLKGRAKILFLSSCWCQIWGLPTLGWQWGNRVYFNLSYLVDLSLITISAERLRHSEILYENLNLSRYLCWKKTAVFSPQAQVHLGTHQFQICSACEVMSYFFAFKSCAPHMLWEKRRQVVLGLKCSLFTCSLPSSCPFPKLGALFTLLPLTWAL